MCSIVAMMQPTSSWVARRLYLGTVTCPWCRTQVLLSVISVDPLSGRTAAGGGVIPLHDLKPGVYAVKLPNEDAVSGAASDYDDEEEGVEEDVEE
jgi:hypothetical protein